MTETMAVEKRVTEYTLDVCTALGEKERLPVVLELYKQAHETRRRWESYIWQYGILLTVLVAFAINWTDQEAALGIAQKVVLTLVSLLVFAIFMNVFRARELMKEIEKTIHKLHICFGANLPIVPLELNSSMLPLFRISSTKIAVRCYLVVVIALFGITAYAWIRL